jgi:membrane-bound serine protease (ClpP class)
MQDIIKKIFSVLISLPVVFLAAFSSAHSSTIDVINIADPITPVVAEFIIRCIDEAEDKSAECIIIQMDTPGGLDLAMREIIKKMLASEVPVVVYVSPGGARAASAGAIITIAAHIAAMAPGTNIGAAHPVSLGGGQMSKEMSEKVENDAAAYVESIAVKRKRNKEWAIKAVRESVSISGEEALKIQVIDFLSPNIETLISDINGKEVETSKGMKKLQTAGVTIQYKKMGVRENILKGLANPNIAYILLMIGLAGLYFELSNPGVIFPGVVGGISLILAFYSLQTLSANYAGVLLILLGGILFILELKVTSYGLLSIAGIAALILGSLMLFQSPVPYLRLSWTVILPSVTIVSLFFITLIGLVVKAQRRKTATGWEGLVGMVGVARSEIGEDGKVFVHGEYWDARSDIPISKRSKVRVKSIEGMLLEVEKID